MSSGGGGQEQSSYQSSKTYFPTDFAAQLAKLGVPYAPFFFNGALPTSTNIGTGGGQQVAPAFPNSGELIPEREKTEQGSPIFNVTDIQDAWAEDPQKFEDFQRLVKRGGLDPNGFTLEEFRSAWKKDSKLSGRSNASLARAEAEMLNHLTVEEQTRKLYAQTQPAATPTSGAGATDGSAGTSAGGSTGGFNLGQFVQDNIQRLYGNNLLPRGSVADGLQFRDSTFTAPEKVSLTPYTAAEANIAPQGFDRYETALREKMFAPVKQQLGQEQEKSQKALQEQLISRGFGDSPVMAAMLRDNSEEYGRRMVDSLEEASFNATVQRTGLESAQLQFNAQQKNAAFQFNNGLTAQVGLEHAKQLLEFDRNRAASRTAVDTARAEAYIKAKSVDVQEEANARTNYNHLLGTLVTDAARQDSFIQGMTALTYNSWLTLLGSYNQAGQTNVSRSKSEPSGGGMDLAGIGKMVGAIGGIVAAPGTGGATLAATAAATAAQK